MKKALLTSVAALFLATGMAQSTPTTDREKAAVYRMSVETCVRGITDGKMKSQDYHRAPVTIEETWDYCRCVAETLAELVTSEEYNSGNKPIPKSAGESLTEKISCIAVEKCKKHLNLPDPSQFQYERCWKG